jgi:ABC-type polysaccharide/polyol phosphate export permease
MELPSNEMIYDSLKRGPHSIEELKALFQYRELLIQLIRRDIVSRYKRSVLGIAWTMLNPLGTMLILVIVFSRVFDKSDNYPIYVLTGVTIWNFFSQVTSASMGTMIWGSSLFEHIYLPRTVFVISSVGTGVVNFFFSLVPLLIIMLFIGSPIYITMLVIPIPLLFLIAFTTGVGLILSTYVVYFEDIRQIYPIVLMAWMYLTPIIVPKDIIAEILGGVMLKFNPFYYLLELFHKLILEGVLPSGKEFLIAALISFSTFIAGWLLFTNRADKLAYYA